MKTPKAILVLLFLVLTASALISSPTSAAFWTTVELYSESFPPEHPCIEGLTCDDEESRPPDQIPSYPAEDVATKVRIVQEVLAKDLDKARDRYGNQSIYIAVSRQVHILRPPGEWRWAYPAFFAQVGGNPALCSSDGCRLLLLAKTTEGRWSIFFDLMTLGSVVFPDLISHSTRGGIEGHDFLLKSPTGTYCTYALGGKSQRRAEIKTDWWSVVSSSLNETYSWITGSHPVYEKTGRCL